MRRLVSSSFSDGDIRMFSTSHVLRIQNSEHMSKFSSLDRYFYEFETTLDHHEPQRWLARDKRRYAHWNVIPLDSLHLHYDTVNIAQTDIFTDHRRAIQAN